MTKWSKVVALMGPVKVARSVLVAILVYPKIKDDPLKTRNW